MGNALELHDLKKAYRGQGVLRGATLSIPEGRLALYLGANGAGKTTTMRLVAGLERADAGSVTLLGGPPRPELRHQLALTLEEPRFYPWLSGLDNLRVVAGYRQIRGADRWARESLRRVGLDAAAHRPFRSYSLGMRQRLYLASSLVPELRLLLLDEPTNGLDVEGREAIWDTLTELRDGGVSLLVSTHQILDAERYAEHLAVLHDGRISFCGPYAELAAQRRLMVETPNPEAAQAALAQHGLRAEPGRQRGQLLAVDLAGRPAQQVLGLLSSAGVPVGTSRPEDLEELYWRLKNVDASRMA
ncbi:ABC-2 type transport system ATP-binding protein [Deinococcus reticulitermitis]|uniref:ABC-2 type transport system ATP-binding protein n=1 Tax=Deinococcus reticulitermitis TaxID=856736 RepID=A0A1H6T5C9_9DEIO|nr:ABC transporter ATP-binding protein [Deinococcus reticulitermitis]SEI70982.1 ABC-2 type transport system ATP-binding protein [Deinococcus reticulitermitis]